MNFSVIVPCYNCVKTLENTVNSIRASGLSNYELLLIDDGSTDGTGALCDVLCEKYPELRCIHQHRDRIQWICLALRCTGERRDILRTDFRYRFRDIQPALHIADSTQKCPCACLRGIGCRRHSCGNRKPMQLAMDL